jgi:hypothetical protein
MRYSLPLVLLALAPACSRELEPLSTRVPEPAFLGELSGVYLAFIALDEADREALVASVQSDELLRRQAGTPVRAGDPAPDALPIPYYAPVDEVIYLAHLDSGTEADTIVSVLLPPEALRDDDLSPPEEAFINGPLLAGVLFEDGGLLLTTEQTPQILGIRSAGGGGFRLEDFYRVCAESTRHRLHTSRACEFNPALSGLYATTVSACDGSSPEETYFGLGFVENTLVGVRYPEIDSLMLGNYDPLGAVGFNLVFGGASDPSHVGTYGLFESDGQLTYLETLRPFGEDTCVEKRVGKRLAGGENRACTVASPTDTSLHTFVDISGAGRRDVTVFIVTPDGQRLDAYDFGTVTMLRRADSGALVQPDALPAYPDVSVTYAARYSNLPNGDYELFTIDLDGRASTEIPRNFAPRMGMPECLSIPGQ